LKFKKDIFISYAHIDDEALIEGEPGWVSEFHRSLEIRLAQLLGYRPNIWRDKDLDGNHVFSDEILQQLPDIAIMVSIHSPRYVKSEWCVREVNEFHRIAETNIGALVGTKSRIFKVIKTPVDINHHPIVIQGQLGYEFFKIEPETGKPREFSKLYGKDAQLAYWAKLDDLAHDLASLLEEIGKNEASVSGIDASEKLNGQGKENVVIKTFSEISKPKRKIYLAETSSEIKENRETISRMLSDKGFIVLPDKNLPLEADAYIEEIKEIMSDCEMSIHLIGTKFGLVPEGTEKSKTQIQNEVSAEIIKQRKIDRLIWMAPEANIEDERQNKFIKELQGSETLLSGADLIISPLEDLEFAITDKLSESKKEVIEDNLSDDSVGPKQIYLICDQSDLDGIAPVEDFLFNKGFEVILPAFEGDQTELRLDHQENLKICDAVLIYYGLGNELWLRSKTRDLLKINGYGRKKPLFAKTVFIAPPLTQQKERFRSHEVKVIILTDNNFNLLEEFINEIK
jgi:hypothetical protein